jgi:hypothetical protein
VKTIKEKKRESQQALSKIVQKLFALIAKRKAIYRGTVLHIKGK